MKKSKHEELVLFLNKKFDYNLKVHSTIYGEVMNIDSNNLREAIVLFCDSLNINSGSIGSRDIYTLLDRYLRDNNFQKKVNNL